MKVLFIHGLASSGAFKTSGALRDVLSPAEVIAPDLPVEAGKALEMLRKICRDEAPDLIVGHSMGGFFAQMLRGYNKILINPGFHVSSLLRTMKGEMKFLSPRADGALSFFVTDELCEGFEALERVQFEGIDDEEIRRTFAMFADKDEMVDCSAEFEKYYPSRSVRYSGTHLPTYQEIRDVLVPLAGKFQNN